MDDDHDPLKPALAANDEMLADLARRLTEASKSGQPALRKEALEIMGLLNQARFIYEDAKLVRAKMELASHEHKGASQAPDSESIEPQTADVAKQTLDGMERQLMSLDSKLDMIAAKLDSKDSTDEPKREMQQLRGEIRQIAVKLGQTSPSVGPQGGYEGLESPAIGKRKWMEASTAQSELGEDDKRWLAEFNELTRP